MSKKRFLTEPDAPRVYGEIIQTERRVSERDARYKLRFGPSGTGQLSFDFIKGAKNGTGFRDPAFSENRSQPLHRWVPWIAGFSAQFVEDCFDTFLKHRRKKSKPCVLDPFAGVGTTLVQAILNGYDALGFEINPYAVLACRVKLHASKLDLDALEAYCFEYQKVVAKDDAPVVTFKPAEFETRIPFFSSRVEKQVLTFLDFVHRIPHHEIADMFRVAFGSVMVSFSNYTYEPSLSSRPGAGKPLIENADVASAVLSKLYAMISDVRWIREKLSSLPSQGEGQIYNSNFMESSEVLPPGTVDLVVTSPPYMNNYHYVRNTRPQLFWLSLVSSPKDLKLLEEANFGKYWQTVRDSEPVELTFEYPELSRVLIKLRQTRKEKGSYGGPGWANYVASYFNDCYLALRAVKRVLSRGGVGVIVIGNSIIQGHEMKTDLVLADIARQTGLWVEGVQRIRTKRVGASITKSTVRRGERSKAVLYESAIIIGKK